MNNSTRRNRLYLDPNLKGIIYHTIKFCDYYGFEYASIKRDIKVPLLKIETDFTSQSAGQLLTRVQAFAETLEGSEDMDPSKGISEEIKEKNGIRSLLCGRDRQRFHKYGCCDPG
mgnify:FL=1